MAEIIYQIDPQQKAQLEQWLKKPNGSLRLGRAGFEAVEGGGVLVRVMKYTIEDARTMRR